METFKYENTETVLQKGGKMIRKISIKKGRGYKSITKYHKGKKIYTVKKPIHSHHIKMIKNKKFIPGLFNDCKRCKTKKRRGGNLDQDYDEEMGPEPNFEYMKNIPPDPERFKIYEEKIRMSPVSPEEAHKLFSGPTPEEKSRIENKQMGDEDPLNQHPFDREELVIFRGGKSRRRK